MYPSKRANGIVGWQLVCGTLFSAATARAAEPQATPAATDNSTTSTTAVAPAGASVPSNPNEPSPPPAPQAVGSPTEVQAPSSPNSVAASPYGEAAVAVPYKSPQRSEDVPATLLDTHSDYSIGGFGGLGVMYTRFGGGDRPLVCGEGAVIIDHAFTLGGGGCWIADDMKAIDLGVSSTNTKERLQFGYGGAIIRYHLFSRRVTNLALGALVGAGGLVVGQWDTAPDGDDSDKQNFTVKTQDGVFVLEPQVAGFANLTRWLRIGAIAGYRFVSGVDLRGLKAADLRGPTLGGQIQAGWF